LDAIDARPNIAIPETNDASAALIEPRGAPLVVFVVRMLTAICRDHLAAFKADEIDDEGTEVMLAAEFEAAQASVASMRS
jgi:hypothetical protein